jgi:hypothetical protein
MSREKQSREAFNAFTEEYNREEEAKHQAPFRKSQAELHAATREDNRRVKSFYSLDLTEMGGFPIGSAVVDTLAVGFGNFLTRHTLRDHREENEIYREFRKGLESQNILLSEDGYRRLGSWISVQVAKGDVEPSAELWQCGLDRLTTLGCFRSGESNYQAAQQSEPVQAEQGLDDLLRTTSAESRTGRKILVDAVHREVVDDCVKAYFAFEAECKAMFGDRTFTAGERQALSRIVDARNLNGTNIKSWHTARVLAAKRGSIREFFLSKDERLAIDIERGRVSMDSFEAKQRLNRRIAEINGMGR